VKRLWIALVVVSALALTGSAATVTLVAGQHFNAGVVYCHADAETLRIDIVASDAWKLVETHVYVGTEAPKKSAPGRFPYKHENLRDTSSDTYKIALDEFDIACGQVLYVAVHAVVVSEETRDEETAWGDGSYIRTGKNWAMYFTSPVFCEGPK